MHEIWCFSTSCTNIDFCLGNLSDSFLSQGSKSWLRWDAWDPMTSFNSWFNVLWCKVQVVSRALIGLLTIVAITFVFLRCSATANRIMPVTYIVLLLGLLCGTAGKFCIDTLGGNGNIWVMWWEVFCALHFLCNVFTSTLYLILYGSVDVSQGAKRKTRLPYCIRQVVFFAILFLLLPVFCGLLPFASLGEWKHHFVVWVTDLGYWWWKVATGVLRRAASFYSTR